MAGDRVDQLLSRLEPVDEESRGAALDRWSTRAKPKGGLGRLETLGAHMAAIRRTPRPAFHRKSIAVFAADHGITEEGISSSPRSLTLATVQNILRGTAAISVLSRLEGADLSVVDVGIDGPPLAPRPGLFPRKIARGTQNFAQAPAMNHHEARESVRAGIDVMETLLNYGADLVALGDVGVGNTTSASAMVAVLARRRPEDVVGPGSGLTPERVAHKAMVVASALERHSPAREDPWEVLTTLGGFEIGALSGASLMAASRHVPVIVDGFIGATAVLWAAQLSPFVREYLVASHVASEPGHAVAMEALGLMPYFNFDLQIGEGAGAALQLGLCDAASRLLSEMAAENAPSPAVEGPWPR